MIRLFYNPGSCSLASHIALEEAGIAYEPVLIDFKKVAQASPEYLAVNPWGRVPALDVDGKVLTESIAILPFIADLVPEKKLLPPLGTWERAKASELFGILAGTVHISFRSMFRPDRLADTEEGKRAVLEVGIKALERVLLLLDQRIASSGGPYLLGKDFSLCDAHLFVFTTWLKRPAVVDKLPRFSHIEALAARLRERPAFQRALTHEGIA